MSFGVGVIGATGYIGVPYRREIRESGEDVKIVALCARRRELLAAAQQEDGADLITSDWREIVDHPDVNLVIVATPDALHLEPVIACAEKGKHLVCEKPIGVDTDEARQMWAAYRDSGLAHFVPFWTRYVPVFAKAREVVRNGMLGDIRAIVYRWHNPRPMTTPFTWRDDASLSSAGSIADVGSHAYDVMRWILGQEAVRVFAHADVITDAKPDLGELNLEEAIQWGEVHAGNEGQPLRKGTAFDYASIAFQMENNAVGTLILSHAPYIRKGLSPELELHGTDASLAVDRLAGKLTLAKPGNEIELLADVGNPDFGNRFAKHVFPALRAQLAGKSTEHPNMHDGYRVQLFTDAAATSAKRGGWVSVAESENSQT